MLLTFIFAAVMSWLPMLLAAIVPVDRREVDIEPMVALDVTNKLPILALEPTVRLDVTRLFMLPVKELNWKHPMLLAVIVPLDRKDVDMVLNVAKRDCKFKVLTLDVMTEPYGAGSLVA